MKTVLLLGGPADGQRVEVHGTMRTWISGDAVYHVAPLCSHGEVQWFGVLDGADPLALLVAGYHGYTLDQIADAAIRAGMPDSTFESLSLALQEDPR